MNFRFLFFLNFLLKVWCLICSIDLFTEKTNTSQKFDTNNVTNVIINYSESIWLYLNTSNCQYFIDKQMQSNVNTTILALKPNISLIFQLEAKLTINNPLSKFHIFNLSTIYFKVGQESKFLENSFFEFSNGSLLTIQV